MESNTRHSSHAPGGKAHWTSNVKLPGAFTCQSERVQYLGKGLRLHVALLAVLDVLQDHVLQVVT